MGEKARPEIVIIAAIAEENRVIGKGLDLPWRISEDLKRFKRLTLGHPIIMGRRTFESLLHQFGGPLRGRENIVLTSRPLDVEEENVHASSSIQDAIEAFADRDKIFIGGGESVYRATLPLAERLELTLVEGDFEGDAFFPPYEHLLDDEFELVEREAHRADGTTPAFRFETHLRRS
ncbi:MAG: dihydrofolate reductase [Rubricoccaceae bacterium]|nr:dihydrofolate reductase [Rubricoccaceae bacterium]